MPIEMDARIAEWQKSLLDTTKRNRLIKFTAGRGGGLAVRHPTAADLWHGLVVDGRSFRFPWKRDLLGLPAEVIDHEPLDHPAPPPAETTEPPADAATPPRPTAGGPPPGVAAPKSLRELTAECLGSGRLAPDHLLTDLSDRKLETHLLQLSRKSLEAETDHGVSTLYMAFGFLRWFEAADSEEEILSPLALVPVRLSRESVQSAWTLQGGEGDDAAVTNNCLAELMAFQFRWQLPLDLDADSPSGWADYLRRVAEKARGMTRWQVVPDAALGVFNFQKLAMWEDLGRNAERVASHPLCRALAGDTGVDLRPPAGLPNAIDLDERVAPEAVTHILDCDSSQHEAVEAVKRGANVVIDGPPGTGKSQTIANAIAELLAAGKTVLFVSEKTAALEVVKRRLDDRGLGDFCLELHSHKANKREVAAELGRCLDLPAEAAPEVHADLRRLADERRRLNAYARELHRRRQPLGLTVFQAHGELARLDALPERSRWAAADVPARDGEYLRRATEVLRELPQCRAVIEDPAAHPWRECRFAAVTQAGLDDARHHLEQLAQAARTLTAGNILADLGIAPPTATVAHWRTAADAARQVAGVPPVPPGWFRTDPAVAATAARSLHAATTQVREFSGRLGSFSSEAVARLDGTGVASLLPPSGRRELLARGASLTARQRGPALRDLAEALDALAPALDRLAAAFGRVLPLLFIPPRAARTSQARQYAQVAREFAAGPAVCAGWWEPARRKELGEVVGKAAGEEQAAQAERTALAAKLAPAAFSAEAAGVVRDALRAGGSFWGRLFGPWGRLQRQVGGWYAGRIPARAEMLTDLAALDGYHRRAEYLRQVAAEYAGDLLLTPAARPDWQGTADGLKAVERYELRKPSAELKAALAPGGLLDRPALVAAADELAAADGLFRRAWAEVSPAYAPHAGDKTLDEPPAALAERVRDDAAAAIAEAGILDGLVALLRDGADLPPGVWGRAAAELTERVTLRDQVTAHARTLGLGEPTAEVEARDWSALAATGEALLRYLARAGGPLPPATVAALSDGPVRERLREAVGVSDRVLADGLAESWAYVAGSLFPADVPLAGGTVLASAPLAVLRGWAEARLTDLPRVEEWVRYQRVRREVAALGIESVLDEVLARRVSVENAADAFRQRFLKLWLDGVYAQVPDLAAFSADDHDRLVERFAESDRRSVHSAPLRVRAGLLAHPLRPRTDGAAPDSSELGVLLREANKKRRHLPVRRLFAQVPTLLPRLKPCVMMSPLAVSTYLNGTPAEFDVVIFDEASQVRPHDAVCAVYRGRQLVVAGDPKQLPPTDFFARAMGEDGDADEGEEGTQGFESLLDICLALGMVRKRLRWHYRSRREGLIAFSNRHFYGGELVTFPSADDAAGGAVRLVRLTDGLFRDGANEPEARRVADLVVDHARASPDASLGVIAFSQRQQNRILDELEVRRKRHPELEDFFREDRPERFFVKNLENVQGDERDVIVLSVGYGPNATGRVLMNFGPLNRQGGERRLNVAVTRARTGMTVVSSMAAADIDLTRTSAEGARLLRAFLDYAERGPQALADGVTAASLTDFDSPFEREVCDELRRRGLTVHTQVGCSGFKIDLAVVSPDGRYLLGVECDGATYHASATARDRDRLRQAVLEGLGWRLCRIWSTDWVRSRERQVQRVLHALTAAPKAAPPSPTPLPRPISPPAAIPAPPPPSYAGIDEVSEPVLRDTILTLVSACGATALDDLCKATAARLGFKRTGARIRQRIEAAVQTLLGERRLSGQSDGRIGLTNSGG